MCRRADYRFFVDFQRNRVVAPSNPSIVPESTVYSSAHLLKLKRGEIRSQFLLCNNNFGDYQSHLRWWLHNAIMDPGFSNFILFSGTLNMYLSPSSNKSSGQPLKLSSSSMQEEI